jgi:hypothetical protein
MLGFILNHKNHSTNLMDTSNSNLLAPFFSSFAQSEPPTLEKAWEQVNYDDTLPHPSPRSGVGEAYFHRQMYIFGGYHQGQALNDLWTFDLDLLVWRQLNSVGDVPTPRTSHSMCVDHERAKLYVLCGSGSVFGSTNLGDVFEFDLLLHTWTRIDFQGDVLFPRYGQTAILFKRKIFIFGGTYGREFCGDFLVLDLETKTCSQLPLKGEFACPRYKHSAVFLPPNKMLVHGGATTQNYKLDDTYLVDLDSYNWVRLECIGDIPSGQFAHSLCVSPLTKTVWLFGGCDRVRCMSDLYKLECFMKEGQKVWMWKRVRTDNSPPPRYFHACVFDETHGSIILWGGKGAIAEQVRFRDCHRISVDNGDRKRIKLCMPQCTFGSDLLRFLVCEEGEELSDVRLVSNSGEYLSCHKIILRARCPILFRLDDSEDSIQLDVSAACLALLVWYLYSGEIPLQFSCFDALCCAQAILLADRLDLPSFKTLVQKHFIRSLSFSTASSALTVLNQVDVFANFLQVFVSVHSGSTQLYDEETHSSVIQTISTTITNTLRNDVLAVFGNPSESDFELIVGDKVLPAHLFILASRSAYFRSQCMRKFMMESISKRCSFELPIRFSTDGLADCEGFEDERATTSKLETMFGFMIKYIYGGEASLDGSIDSEFAKIVVRLDLANYFGLSNSHLQNFCLSQLSLTGEKNSRIPQQRSEVPMVTMPAMFWSSFSGLNTRYRSR